MALAVPLSRFTSRVGGGSAFYVRLFHLTQNMKRTLLSLAFVIFVSACSHKTDSDLTKSDKAELMSFVSQKTTNAVMGFTLSTNGYVAVDTSGERFVFHHAPDGWVLINRAATQSVAPK